MNFNKNKISKELDAKIRNDIFNIVTDSNMPKMIKSKIEKLVRKPYINIVLVFKMAVKYFNLYGVLNNKFKKVNMPEIQTIFNPNLIDLTYEEELIFFNHLISISSKEMLIKNYYLDLFRIKQNIDDFYQKEIRKNNKTLNMKLRKTDLINKPKLIFHFNSFIKKDLHNYPIVVEFNKNYFKRSFLCENFLNYNEISGFDLEKNIFLFCKGLKLSNLSKFSNFNKRNLIFIYCFFSILEQVINANNKKSLKELKISEIINVFTYLNVSFFSTLFDFSEFSKQSFILNGKNQRNKIEFPIEKNKIFDSHLDETQKTIFNELFLLENTMMEKYIKGVWAETLLFFIEDQIVNNVSLKEIYKSDNILSVEDFSQSDQENIKSFLKFLQKDFKDFYSLENFFINLVKKTKQIRNYYHKYIEDENERIIDFSLQEVINFNIKDKKGNLKFFPIIKKQKILQNELFEKDLFAQYSKDLDSFTFYKNKYIKIAGTEIFDKKLMPYSENGIFDLFNIKKDLLKTNNNNNINNFSIKNVFNNIKNKFSTSLNYLKKNKIEKEEISIKNIEQLEPLLYQNVNDEILKRKILNNKTLNRKMFEYIFDDLNIFKDFKNLQEFKELEKKYYFILKEISKKDLMENPLRIREINFIFKLYPYLKKVESDQNKRLIKKQEKFINEIYALLKKNSFEKIEKEINFLDHFCSEWGKISKEGSEDFYFFKMFNFPFEDIIQKIKLIKKYDLLIAYLKEIDSNIGNIMLEKIKLKELEGENEYQKNVYQHNDFKKLINLSNEEKGCKNYAIEIPKSLSEINYLSEKYHFCLYKYYLKDLMFGNYLAFKTHEDGVIGFEVVKEKGKLKKLIFDQYRSYYNNKLNPDFIINKIKEIVPVELKNY